jgi:hypothetical protein
MSDNVNSNVTTQQTQGVTSPQPRIGPPTVPPRPPMPELTVLPAPTEDEEESEVDLAELLGDEVEPEPVAAPVVEPPEVRIVTPTPEAYKPTPTSRPLSPTLQGLLRRAKPS